MTGHGRRRAVTAMLALALIGAPQVAPGAALAASSGAASSGAVASGARSAASATGECTASTRIADAPPALGRLQSASAWSLTRGAGVVVAVVDSGVAPNPHLDDVVDPGVNLVPDGTDGAGRTDTFGHGTIIAGQIAARTIPDSGVQGLAPDARILPVRVYAGTGDQEVEAGFGPSTARIAEGIRVAADRGAQIINVSMSTAQPDTALAEAVTYATERGSLVVASAGNRDSTLAVEEDREDGARYPAGFPDAIGVAAADVSGQVTDATIHGPHVRLAAPGQLIPSASALGGDCVIAADAPATSYASAYVAAAAALVAAAFPDETPAQWAYRLEVTAVREDPDRRSDTAGWGIVQPFDALTVVPAAGLRGPASPFTSSTSAPAASVPDKPVAITIGPGADATAITTATAIGLGALVALGAIGALAIFVSRRRDDGVPGRPAPTGRGLYGGDEAG